MREIHPPAAVAAKSPTPSFLDLPDPSRQAVVLDIAEVLLLRRLGEAREALDAAHREIAELTAERRLLREQLKPGAEPVPQTGETETEDPFVVPWGLNDDPTA